MTGKDPARLERQGIQPRHDSVTTMVWGGRRRRGVLVWLGAGLLLATSGCAFDISHVKRVPTEFQATAPEGPGWTLRQDQSVGVGSGFPTRLHQGTRWQLAGHSPQGDVYRTRDQVVTVEASNIYEAMIVMQGDMLVGFYLPVEHDFVAVSERMTLPTAHGGQQ